MQDTPDNSPVQAEDDVALLTFVRNRELRCPRCKYILRGLTVPRCPECGIPLKLTIGATEPFLAAWVFLIIGSFASTGIAVLLDSFYLAKPFNHMDVFSKEWIAWWSFSFTTPISLAAVFLRRPFLKRSRTLQWIIAILVDLITIGQMVFFVVNIR